MTKPYSADELDRLLAGLVRRMDSVNGAVVLSRDGMLVASSGLGREDAEHLAALVSGFQGLSRGACHRFGGGELLQTVVEMDDIFLFMVAAGEDTYLAVVSRADGDAGTVAYEMAELAERLGEGLPADPRLSGTGVG
ncbi:roadblock/LC7 domain-containing protein [Actinomadura sp. 9N407]|uniref:roadblock/LC7 domain-containing protein n=1 Tax=Actinomadura sp. 9N407 TaxID=3375154 RepID=UPI0037A02EDC